jgi:hypothetical protein
VVLGQVRRQKSVGGFNMVGYIVLEAQKWMVEMNECFNIILSDIKKRELFNKRYTVIV